MFKKGDRVRYREINLGSYRGTVNTDPTEGSKFVAVQWDGFPFIATEWQPNLKLDR